MKNMDDRRSLPKKALSQSGEALTAADLLQAFDSLHQNRSGKRPSPHKPLMVLLALGRILRGDDRFMPYTEIQEPGTRLIRDYGLNAKQPDPCLPFSHLSKEKAGKENLWEIRNREELERSLMDEPKMRQRIEKSKDPLMVIRNRSVLKKYQVEAGFTEPVYHLLEGNHRLILEIARRLLDKEFPDTLHADILRQVGLDSLVDDDNPFKKQPRDPKFRQNVLVAYGYSCAVCDYNIRLDAALFGVEAAHIKWHAYQGPDSVDNGLALCTIHHKALDNGAISVDDDMKVMVSDQINGDKASCERNFHRFSGREIHLPRKSAHHPASEYLRWHRDRLFKRPS